MRYLAIVLLAATAAAADPIGQWRFGLGTIDGQPAKVGTMVLTGQTVVSADLAPMRLVCSEAPGITVVLAAGSTGRFSVEPVPGEAGPGLLVLDLATGAAQVDVRDRTPYAGVRVRGGAAEVRVTGTLFTVERVKRDADYVALIRGKLHVGLRKDVAAATGRNDDVELFDHHGVGADVNGVGKPEVLSNRPQIYGAAGSHGSTRDQGLGLDPGGTSDWDADFASELTGSLLDSGFGGPGDEGGGEPPFPTLAEDLVTTFEELGAPPQGSGDTATQISGGTGSAGGGGLALPPPPPPAP